MGMKKDLENIVGSEHVSDDYQLLEKYSNDYSFVQARRPSFILFPQNADEVQRVVRYANKNLIAVIPRSSGVSFYGAGVPSQGGIIVDLSRMNRILKIDPRNKFVTIEPGVTWGQLQKELEKHKMMVCNPLLPHPLKSVVTSSMEGEPILIPKTEYNETFLTAEIVLPNGEMYWSGTAMGKGMATGTFPDSLYPGGRLFLGLQGTMGIVTWANIKAEWLPSVEKILFMPLKKVEDAIEPTYRIQRRMIGRECFVLNNFNMAAILGKEFPDDFEKLRKKLPPFTLILSLAGLHRHPEEKILYEEAAVLEIASELHLDALPTMSDVPGLGKRISEILRRPCVDDVHWKFRYKGSCNDIFFYTTLDRVTEFTSSIEALAEKYGYHRRNIGFYLQPIENGRACFCQYGFQSNPNNKEEIDQVRSLYLEASERVVGMGGLFTNPYGPWANMVYRNTSTLTAVMKVVKNVLDPNNIMNPGKLCF